MVYAKLTSDISLIGRDYLVNLKRPRKMLDQSLAGCEMCEL